MSEEVFEAIAQASAGFVESPAGCGKTEAIVRTVGTYCPDPQLVLTHTNAGVDALRRRFRAYQIPSNKYNVDTIAGWAWGWVRKYPGNASYHCSINIAEWNDVYASMSNLLQKRFVSQGVVNSYAGVIIDEYQDCTVPMHQLIVQLKRLLPCRVLGDDLQSVFGFRDDPVIDWSDVRADFVNDLGILQTPHRWIKAENEDLGRWLLRERPAFREDHEPDYKGSSVNRRSVSYADLGGELLQLTDAQQGRICVIGPKFRRLHLSTESMLVKRGYRVLEPNQLSVLRNLILKLSDGTQREKSNAIKTFLLDAHGGLSSDEKSFICNVLEGKGQRPRRVDRQRLFDTYNSNSLPLSLIGLLEYVGELNGVYCKLQQSVSALKCILEEHSESGTDLKSLYANEIAKRKYQSRSSIFRCIGSTLLVKGLEFDHAVILRDTNWQRSWGNYKDLYVALTRGSKSVTLFDLVA